MNKEKWKKLKQDKNYLVSSWGRIYSLKTKRFMRPYIHKSRANNYLRISLSKNKKFMVHFLVAYNFKFKDYCKMINMHPMEKIQVGHDDRNTLNPNLNNLSFETESENKVHMHRTNRFIWGSKKFKGRLDDNA